MINLEVVCTVPLISSVFPNRERGEEVSSCPGDTGGSWMELKGKSKNTCCVNSICAEANEHLK